MRDKDNMELANFIQSAMGLGIAVCGFFIKRILTLLDDGQSRMTQIEIELARQKQETDDMGQRLERIEDKIDILLETRRGDK